MTDLRHLSVADISPGLQLSIDDLWISVVWVSHDMVGARVGFGDKGGDLVCTPHDFVRALRTIAEGCVSHVFVDEGRIPVEMND